MWMKDVIQRVLVLVVAAVLLPVLAVWSASLQQTKELTERTWYTFHGEAVTSVFKVDSLSCNGCLDTIGNALQELPGTFGLAADITNRVIFVDHQAGLSVDKIGERMSAEGYAARLQGSGRKMRQPASVGSGQKPVPAEGQWCTSRRCGATANAWKELYHRYFDK